MIDYIKGKIAELTPTSVVIETSGGVGYLAGISLYTYTALDGQSDAKIYVHESIREDAYQLFGFATADEREAFRMLTLVNGVGPSSARLIVSALSASELQSVITSEDVATLKRIKGVGQKTAERIIVDLKDKIGKLSLSGEQGTGGQTVSSSVNIVRDEALQALEVLGYAKAAATKVVDKLLREKPDMRIEEIVKSALKLL